VSDDARTQVPGKITAQDAARTAMEFHVQVPGSSELRETAWFALKDELESFGDEVLQEAGRVEDATEDISPRVIRAMALHVRRGYNSRPKKKRSKIAILCEAWSYIAAILAGLFVNNITQPWGAVGLVIISLLGISAFFWARMSGGDN